MTLAAPTVQLPVTVAFSITAPATAARLEHVEPVIVEGVDVGGGGVVVHATVDVTSCACDERFPAASYATTASV